MFTTGVTITATSSLYLIKRWENIVCKLHLGNSGGSVARHSDGKPSNTLLGEGRVENPILAYPTPSMKE
jgi:hypothetical protein